MCVIVGVNVCVHMSETVFCENVVSSVCCRKDEYDYQAACEMGEHSSAGIKSVFIVSHSPLSSSSPGCL